VPWTYGSGSGRSRGFSSPAAIKDPPDKEIKLSYVSYESARQSRVATPLFIQHGMFGRKENLLSIGKRINHLTKRKVILSDARNHGDSPKCSNPSVKQMSSDLLNLQSQLHIPKSSMLGFSTGGRVAMLAALSSPGMVDRLVVTSASPLNTQHTLEKWKSSLEAAYIVDTIFKSRGITTQSEILEAEVELKLEINEALKPTLKDKAGRALFLANLGKSNLKELMNNPDMGRFPNVEDKCFNGPVMFVSGERHPPWSNDDDKRRIKHIFPNAHFENIAGAGHWVHLEKSEDFLLVVVSFLQN